jgi:hypothetical protein
VPEDHQMGTINPQVYSNFVKLNGGVYRFAAVILLALLGYMVCRILGAIFIQIWCDNSDQG